MNPVLSSIQASGLLEARSRAEREAQASFDLGLTHTLVVFGQDGVRSAAAVEATAAAALDPENEVGISWESLAEIAADPNGCYQMEPGGWRKIQCYSEQTGRVFTLYPTRGAPTMLISGLPMHRIKDTDPYQDTQEKIRAARPAGRVLDTCTGLGYTAIAASRLEAVTHVTTVELDPAALQICRANPWSQALFDHPKITQVIGDSAEQITHFPDGAFGRILHDPPYLSLAGDLYSLDFYREALRVLNHNGRMFHYIGDPESKSGRSATAGVIKRLEQAGFRRIERVPRAFGVTASKA